MELKDLTKTDWELLKKASTKEVFYTEMLKYHPNIKQKTVYGIYQDYQKQQTEKKQVKKEPEPEKQSIAEKKADKTATTKVVANNSETAKVGQDAVKKKEPVRKKLHRAQQYEPQLAKKVIKKFPTSLLNYCADLVPNAKDYTNAELISAVLVANMDQSDLGNDISDRVWQLASELRQAGKSGQELGSQKKLRLLEQKLNQLTSLTQQLLYLMAYNQVGTSWGAIKFPDIKGVSDIEQQNFVNGYVEKLLAVSAQQVKENRAEKQRQKGSDFRF